MGILKSKGNKQQGHTLSSQTGLSLNFLLTKNLFEELEDHTLIGSKIPKQEVQLTVTLIFKMQIKLHWMHVKIKIYTKHKVLNYLYLSF